MREALQCGTAQGPQLSAVLRPGLQGAALGSRGASGPACALWSRLRLTARQAHPRRRPAWLSWGPQSPSTPPEKHNRGALTCLPAPCPVPSLRVPALGRPGIGCWGQARTRSLGTVRASVQGPGPGGTHSRGLEQASAQPGDREPAACGPQRSRRHTGLSGPLPLPTAVLAPVPWAGEGGLGPPQPCLGIGTWTIVSSEVSKGASGGTWGASCLDSKGPGLELGPQGPDRHLCAAALGRPWPGVRRPGHPLIWAGPPLSEPRPPISAIGACVVGSPGGLNGAGVSSACLPAWRSQKAPPGRRQAPGLHLHHDTCTCMSAHLARPVGSPCLTVALEAHPHGVGARGAKALSDAEHPGGSTDPGDGERDTGAPRGWPSRTGTPQRHGVWGDPSRGSSVVCPVGSASTLRRWPARAGAVGAGPPTRGPGSRGCPPQPDAWFCPGQAAVMGS